MFGVRERKGFIQLTGEVGCGKTTLCRAMLDQLDSHYCTALILNPILDPKLLIKSIAIEFGLQVKGMDGLEIMAALNEFLLEQTAAGKEPVLVIDEAQDLDFGLLEQIRLLSNLETDEQKLLQIVILGQPELRHKLNDSRLRQLRQRITIRYHLNPLRYHEIGRYIQHRLSLCGANGVPDFTSAALWRVYLYSGGIPRLINAIADKCLLACFVKQKERIDYRTVGLAIRELEGRL